MSLTDTVIRRSKVGCRPYKLFDSKGLFLLVTPGGGKWWRFKYRFAGKENLLSLGTYPEVSLKQARDLRDNERKKLADKIDPAATRKTAKAALADHQANNFEVIAREWIGKQSPVWRESNIKKITGMLKLHIFPWLGDRPITEITAPELLSAIRRVESRGSFRIAHHVLQSCGRIFRYAIATGCVARDPAADLRGALVPYPRGHFAAVTEPDAIGTLLRTMNTYQSNPVTRSALQLAPLVFVRPAELRKAEWKEIDFARAVWCIPAERMKMKAPHIVPLARQAVEILRAIHPQTGGGRYVFPSPRSDKKPMSDGAILNALRTVGISKEEMTGHGFRAMARTVLDEVLHVRPDYIEHQLAHAVRDPNGRAYNRTAHLPERHEMMQLWADYLDELRGQKTITSPTLTTLKE